MCWGLSLPTLVLLPEWPELRKQNHSFVWKKTVSETDFLVLRLQIRRAIVADTAAGHTLIVAEHQQLEAHLLAHLAACPALAACLSSGAGHGDFAALAASVFPHINDAIASGENTGAVLMLL